MDEYGTSMRKPLLIGLGALALVLACAWTAESTEESGGSYGLGRAATDEEIRVRNIDVSSTGEGLPSGQGTVKQGAQVFATKCAMCHGPSGTEGPKDKLVGGRDTLKTAKAVRTVGSYWPYAPTLYDYINRAMPFNAPGSLNPDEVYSVIAWLLFQNEIVKEDAVINAQTLPQVQMPNRNGFIQDPRPDVPSR
jgi:S-disulfanyl-L-cysteine oxidoreductase SoxD